MTEKFFVLKINLPCIACECEYNVSKTVRIEIGSTIEINFKYA